MCCRTARWIDSGWMTVHTYLEKTRHETCSQWRKEEKAVIFLFFSLFPLSLFFPFPTPSYLTSPLVNKIRKEPASRCSAVVVAFLVSRCFPRSHSLTVIKKTGVTSRSPAVKAERRCPQRMGARRERAEALPQEATNHGYMGFPLFFFLLLFLCMFLFGAFFLFLSLLNP